MSSPFSYWWYFTILHDAWGVFDIIFLFTASFDGEKHAINLPSVNSASFVLRFLEKLCHSLQCDNLFSSQPFSPYMGCAHSPMEYDRNKPGTVNHLLFSNANIFEKGGDFMECCFLVFLWHELLEINTLQFLVNWFHCGSALTVMDRSYHMCRNNFVQQTSPCRQARKHLYFTTVILLKRQAQNLTFHLLNLCLAHKINLPKDACCLWEGTSPEREFSLTLPTQVQSLFFLISPYLGVARKFLNSAMYSPVI